LPLTRVDLRARGRRIQFLIRPKLIVDIRGPPKAIGQRRGVKATHYIPIIEFIASIVPGHLRSGAAAKPIALGTSSVFSPLRRTLIAQDKLVPPSELFEPRCIPGRSRKREESVPIRGPASKVAVLWNGGCCS
jgi:hypothetical protein